MADPTPPAVTVLLRHPSITIRHYVCTAGPDSPSFAERHGAPTIALVRRGTFRYHAEGAGHTLVPGALLLGDSGREYRCSHEHAGGDDCLSVELTQPLLTEIDAELRRGPHVGRFGRPVLPPLPRLAALLQVAQSALAGQLSEIALDELALLVAREVLLALGDGPDGGRRSAGPRPRDRERAIAAALLFEQRFADPLSLEEVAGSVGLGTFQFVRVFRGELGIPPHQFLLRTRLRKAAEQLLDTSLPITEIAYGVGFGDLSNFVRTFHRTVGCSPRQFRKGGLVQQRKILQELNRDRR